jgi:hypothetical protein
MAKEQEMKKTSNPQRPTLNAECSNLILRLSVGCWTLDHRRSFLL